MSAHMPGCVWDTGRAAYTTMAEGCAAPEEHVVRFVDEGGTFPGDRDVMASGHTRHCEARKRWGDGECECSKGRALSGGAEGKGP